MGEATGYLAYSGIIERSEMVAVILLMLLAWAPANTCKLDLVFDGGL